MSAVADALLPNSATVDKHKFHISDMSGDRHSHLDRRSKFMIATTWIVATGVLAVTLYVQPSWYKRFCHDIGLPHWVFRVSLLHPIVQLVSLWATIRIWQHPEFSTFMEEIKDEPDFYSRVIAPTFLGIVPTHGATFMLFFLIIGLSSLGVCNGDPGAMVGWLFMYSLPLSVLVEMSVRLFRPLLVMLVLATKFRAQIFINDLGKYLQGDILDEHVSSKATGRKLDKGSVSCADGEWKTPEWWDLRIREHKVFNEDLLAVWDKGASLLSIRMLDNVLTTFEMAAFGVSTRYLPVSVGFLCLSFIASMASIWQLAPLASITSLCQNLGPGGNSIRKTAARYNGMGMDHETRVAYMAFTQYLDRTPTGIELPMIGQINYAMLAAKTSTLAAVIPTFLAFAKAYITG